MRNASLWLMLSCTLFLGTGVFFHGYLTDDTFIHMQFARNLVEGNGISFNPGERSYGCTSPGWILLLAASGALRPSYFFWAKLWGVLAGLASIYFFYRLAGILLPDRKYAVAATFVWAGNAWLLRWSNSGMETSLAAMLVVASLYFHLSNRRVSTAIALGLGFLVRPETALLILIVLLDLAVRKRYREALRVGLLAALIALPWLVFARVYFGSFLPDTAAAKAGTAPGLGEILRGANRPAKALGLTNGLEAALFVVSILLGSARSFWKGFLKPAVAPSLWLVSLPLFYVLAGYQVISRYLVPVIPVLVLLGFWSLEWLARRTGAARRGVLLGVVLSALLVVQNLAVTFIVVYPHTHRFSESVRQGLVKMAVWFRDNTPPGATVAIPDVGVFGFYSERRIFDLAGLVSPEVIPLLKGGDWESVVEHMSFAQVARPEFLVDRSTDSLRLVRSGEWAEVYEPLLGVRVESLGVTQPGTYFYTAYRIRWDAYDRIAARSRR